MLLGTFAYSQKLDCNKFKNGKFGAAAFPDEYFVRKDAIQESYMDGKVETVWSIKWLSDCKMEAVCVKNYGSEYVKVGDRSVSEFTDFYDDCYTISILYYNKEHPNGDAFKRGFCVLKD